MAMPSVKRMIQELRQGGGFSPGPRPLGGTVLAVLAESKMLEPVSAIWARQLAMAQVRGVPPVGDRVWKLVTEGSEAPELRAALKRVSSRLVWTPQVP